MAEVQKKIYQTFGIDGIGLYHGLHGTAMLFGAEVTADPHIPCSIVKNPFYNFLNIEQLDLEKMTLAKDPIANKCYEGMQILLEDLGREIISSMGFAGPISAASGLVGVKPLLASMKKAPERVHQLLQTVTAGILQLTTPFLQLNAPISLSDPVASGSLISPNDFRQFAVPYYRQIIEHCKAYGQEAPSIHICGNTSKILEDIGACGFSSFSIDNVVDLAEAKRCIGSMVHLLGNVDPQILYWGDAEGVKAAVRACAYQAWDSPCGYTICNGCDAVYHTPLENGLAFMQEARKCAKYPYDIYIFLPEK